MAETTKCQLRMPNQARLFEHIKENASHRGMVTYGSAVGKSVIVCGAGPSLSDHLADLKFTTSEVWACNSALLFLIDKGIRVTHGFTIDQGEAMLTEWARTFDVTYLVASSVHPKLLKHLKGRTVKMFHSYLGLPDPEGEKDYEMWLYTHLYPTSVQVGHGLNAVPRAVCLALAMGYSDIRVYGADCAARPNQSPMPEYLSAEYTEWVNGLVLYADGRTVGECWGSEAVVAEAPDIDGRRWHTRPDMIISARHLLELEQAYPNRITLVGDTLPNALRDKDKSFNDRLPELTAVGEVAGFGAAA